MPALNRDDIHPDVIATLKEVLDAAKRTHQVHYVDVSDLDENGIPHIGVTASEPKRLDILQNRTVDDFYEVRPNGEILRSQKVYI